MRSLTHAWLKKNELVKRTTWMGAKIQCHYMREDAEIPTQRIYIDQSKPCGVHVGALHCTVLHITLIFVWDESSTPPPLPLQMEINYLEILALDVGAKTFHVIRYSVFTVRMQNNFHTLHQYIEVLM